MYFWVKITKKTCFLKKKKKIEDLWYKMKPVTPDMDYVDTVC